MAVEDKYINSAVEAGNVAAAYKQQGSGVIVMTQTFEVAAADDDGSVYRVFPDVNPHLVPIKVEVVNDAITGGTSFDFGLYNPNSGAVVNKNVLASAVSMASARAVGSEGSLLSAVNRADLGKTLFDLVSGAIGALKGGYDLALTANTVGTVAGTITVTAYFVQGF